MLAFVDLEERVPPHHHLRTVKRFADRLLATLSPTFDAMYGDGGRLSIPPERLLEASQLKLVLGAQRADFLCTAGLRLVVAVVSGCEPDRAEHRPVHIQQRPRSPLEAASGVAILR